MFVRPPRIALLALALFSSAALLMGSANLAHAEGTCTAPDARGFERLEPEDDDSGIGGTGARPQTRVRTGDDDDSGVGGTGFRPGSPDDDASGIGGTGLFGRISHVTRAPAKSETAKPGAGHTSRICLNGIEVTIPASLNVEASDGATSVRSVAAGQLAYVEAARTDSGVLATRIVLDTERAGQIEVIARDGRTLVVSGETLKLAHDVVSGPGIDVRQLEAGDWIRFQAHRDTNAAWVATRIDAGTKSLVQRGDTRFEARVADLIGARAKNRAANDDFYVSIEGVLRGSAERPEILGVEVRVGHDRSTTGVEARAALRDGARVRIGGHVGRDQQIDVGAPPRWLSPPRDARPIRQSESTPQAPPPQKNNTPPDPRRIDKPVKPTPPAKPPIRPTRPSIRPDVRPKLPTKGSLRR